MNHPNRGRGAHGYIPTPAEVRAYRGDMTQAAAAALIYTTDRIWRNYESGDSRMHPASWDLLQRIARDNMFWPRSGIKCDGF